MSQYYRSNFFLEGPMSKTGSANGSSLGYCIDDRHSVLAVVCWFFLSITVACHQQITIRNDVPK